MTPGKVYTRGGDKGETFCPALGRVPKTNPRVAAVGALDELNCALGELAVRVAASPIEPARRRTVLRRLKIIQRELFMMGTRTSGSAPARRGPTARDHARVARLEAEIDAMESQMPPCTGFILPGGSASASAAHIARSTCRRAERDNLAALAGEPAAGIVIPYLNRLADWLFVLARWLTHAAGCPDEYWHRPANDKSRGKRS